MIIPEEACNKGETLGCHFIIDLANKIITNSISDIYLSYPPCNFSNIIYYHFPTFPAQFEVIARTGKKSYELFSFHSFHTGRAPITKFTTDNGSSHFVLMLTCLGHFQYQKDIVAWGVLLSGTMTTLLPGFSIILSQNSPSIINPMVEPSTSYTTPNKWHRNRLLDFDWLSYFGHVSASMDAFEGVNWFRWNNITKFGNWNSCYCCQVTASRFPSSQSNQHELMSSSSHWTNEGNEAGPIYNTTYQECKMFLKSRTCSLNIKLHG